MTSADFGMHNGRADTLGFFDLARFLQAFLHHPDAPPRLHVTQTGMSKRRFAARYLANETQINCRSFRTNIHRWANAGWHQTTLRPNASLVGSRM